MDCSLKIIALEMDSSNGYLVVRYKRENGCLGALELNNAIQHVFETRMIGEKLQGVGNKALEGLDLKEVRLYSVYEKARKCSDASIRSLHKVYVTELLLEYLQASFETCSLNKDDPALEVIVNEFAKELNDGDKKQGPEG